MHRYGIQSFEALISAWNRGQIYLAIDGAFWNSPKEKDKWGPTPVGRDLRGVRAADFMSVMGLPTHA